MRKINQFYMDTQLLIFGLIYNHPPQGASKYKTGNVCVCVWGG